MIATQPSDLLFFRGRPEGVSGGHLHDWDPLKSHQCRYLKAEVKTFALEIEAMNHFGTEHFVNLEVSE